MRFMIEIEPCGLGRYLVRLSEIVARPFPPKELGAVAVDNYDAACDEAEEMFAAHIKTRRVI
jgi:hypothetical protein